MKKIIKQIVLVLVIWLVMVPFIYATVGVETYVLGEKVNLCIVLNHAESPQYSRLLYKARLHIMGDYIQKKIDAGELEDKKFEIVCSSTILNRPHLEITQGKNGYYVCMGDFPDLTKLLSLVEYFARPDWKPFEVRIEKEEDETVYFNFIETFYKTNKPVEIDIPILEVWQLDDLKIIYGDDALTYTLKEEYLPFPVNANLPVKINDRYLLFESKSYITKNIHVIENTQIIQTYNFEDFNREEDYLISVYPKWVNITYLYSDDWLISYSYEKNKFYEK